MLFGKRKRIVKRILIVEDEPLTAFDNETMLVDAGYEIVATVDDFEEAMKVLEREQVDLILSDVRLRSQQTGIHLAKAAKERGIPTLFATGHPYPGACGDRRRLPAQALFRTPAVEARSRASTGIFRVRQSSRPRGSSCLSAPRLAPHRRTAIERRPSIHRGARQVAKPS